MRETEGYVHVSEVLDYLQPPELVNWRLNNSKAKCKAIQDEALRVGTLVDRIIMDELRGTPQDLAYIANDTPVANCLLAWEKFKGDFPGFVESVSSVQGELKREGVIGHPDFIHDNGKRIGITDLKTSTSIRPRYWTQTAKYLDLYASPLPDTDICFLAVLRLDKKTGDYEYKITDFMDYIRYEVSVFNAYLLAYWHNYNNREMIRAQLERELGE